MRHQTRLVLWVLVLLGVLAALWVAARRWKVEAANRRVEIVLDWSEVRGLADETGTPVTEVLRRFYQAGARGMAVSEETVGALEAIRWVEIVPPSERAGRGSRRSRRQAVPETGALPAEMTTTLRIADGALRARVGAAIQRKWRARIVEQDDELTVPAAWDEIAGLPIGFPADVISTLRAAHLEPVLRPLNFLGADPETVDGAVQALKLAGGRLVIFGGDQVLGYQGTIKEAASAMEANGLLFGQIEFGKQKGEEKMAAALKGGFVRVHSINPVEMSRMGPADAVDRFLRAAQERNIRCLYIRLLPGAPSPAVGENVSYIDAVSRALAGNRPAMTLGLAAPFAPYETSTGVRCLIGLAVAAATLLIATYLWPVSGLTLLALLVLAAADVALPAVGIGRQIVALQGALLMPVLAFLVLRSTLEKRYRFHEESPEPPATGSLVRSAWRSLPLYACTSAISIMGALIVVGLLSSRLGTVKVAEFRGIKLQQAGTILFVLLIFALEISSRGGIRAARARVQRRVVELWNQPLMLGGLALALVGLLALALLIARSGNDPGVGISPIEMRFRGLLDTFLGVRPRTKEFLIGHPALLLGIALAMRRQPRWAVAFLVVGAIGQVGIVNTFCHLHTPLFISVMHAVNGLWTGAVVALVYAWVADRFRPRVPGGVRA